MSYLDFLNYLLSLGPKLPLIMASIQRIVAEVQILREIIGGGVVVQEAFASHSEAEAAAEQQVIAAAMGGAETFGGPFQNILAFLKAHPELIALLLSFLKK
jgi:hypothetical protein